MDKLAVALGLYDTGPAQDGQVLGSDGLLEPELDIKFGDCQLFMFVQDPDDLLPEFVIQRAKDHRRLLEVDKIYFNGGFLSRLGVEDHPIITACATHTVRSVEGLKKSI
jgi:hypothetical protein